MMEKWVVAAKKADFNEIAKKFQINPVIARLIRNRDIIGEEAIEEYLNGSLLNLHDPHLLKDCDKAVDILLEKINDGKRIRVIGDYDIDGVNASYILYRGLKRCGAEVDVDIPERIKDGYGINEHLVKLADDDDIDTIITCDNGIAAIEQIQMAKDLGMTVIVTDHHEIQEVLPPAHAIVNPKQEDCSYPYSNLCGATVAYKVIVCLYEAMGILAAEALDFIENIAIATVGDVMDLTGENRLIVKEGLLMLAETKNAGLRALIKVNGLADKQLSAYHIGFVLGPCINASGRLDTAKRALGLLLEEDEETALDLAEELKGLNEERKDLTSAGLETAIRQVEEGILIDDDILVVYLPECHESLAGIIAGRLRERYHKPAIVLTKAEEGVKGSGRSTPAYHMFDRLCECSDLLTKFGGHPMAAGMSLAEENVTTFRKRINTKTGLTAEDFIPKTVIDVAMPLDYISESLIAELEYLEPFGKANSKPVFAEKDLDILGARILGKNKNVIKMQVLNQNGMTMEAMYFGDIQKFQEYLTATFGTAEVEKLFQNRQNKVKLSVTYYPTINEYMGKKTIQIIVSNYQ